MKRNVVITLAAVLFCAFAGIVPSYSGSTESVQKNFDERMQKAIWEYKHENFEEAYDLLKALRKDHRDSSMVAYYLGITCKQMQDYSQARPNLEAAVTLKPKIKNALLELIDLLCKKGEYDEAMKWVLVAEKENINPPQIAFFKGLILFKQGESFEEARKSLEIAKGADPALADTADYYIGLSYVKEEKFDSAKNIFNDITVHNPQTSLGTFARQYVDAINEKERATRPLRGNIGAALQYDDNVILQPDAFDSAVGIGNKADWRQVYTGHVEYNFKPVKEIGVKAGYSMYYAKQFDLGFYDTFNNHFTIQPGYYPENAAITFPVEYNHVTVNDKSYLSSFGFGTLDNFKLGKDQMIQAGAAIRKKDYLWEVRGPGENRDSTEYFAQIGWYYFFAKGKGFAHMGYVFNYDDTKGQNWRHAGNTFRLASTVPLSEKLRLACTAEYQNEVYTDTNLVYSQKRKDNLISCSGMFVYEIFKDVEVQFSYNHVNSMSNISVYEYKRNIYSIGLKYIF